MIKAITEGNQYFFYKNNTGKNKLVRGTIYHCDNCKKFASVNTVGIVSGASRNDLIQAETIGALEDLDLFCDEGGNEIGCFCSTCYFILNNRSLAENDPANLLNRGFDFLDEYYKKHGGQAFNKYINDILNRYE